MAASGCKECPEHGRQTARIYGDAQSYLKLGHFHRKASVPLAFATKALGCPDSCGICPAARAACLSADSRDHRPLQLGLPHLPGHQSRPSPLDPRGSRPVLDGLIQSEGQIDVLNLSGGEPTMNPYFREIVEECLSRKEILRVSVSTNGSVLVRNRELLEFLAERRVIVSLQFDGMSDDIYWALRGRPLIEEKRRLIDLCGELDAPMSLTATVVSGVNDSRLTEIAGLLFQYDHILSVMFQPAAYAGSAALGNGPLAR
jgi:uncharacterized radical SAM superfamily Fe-S cluster-containing enzyme